MTCLIYLFQLTVSTSWSPVEERPVLRMRISCFCCCFFNKLSDVYSVMVNAVITLGIFLNQCEIWWQKWFMETGQTTTVTNVS